jgi:hypothetical protein
MFNIPQDPELAKQAYLFQINANLEAIRLLNCAAERRDRTDGELEVRLRMDFGTAVLAPAEDRARFAVTVTVVGELKHSDDAGASSNEPEFRLTCKYELVYVLKPGYEPTSAQLDAFRQGNAIFQCWPYSRELFQNMAMRMELGIPPLPFLRLVVRDKSAESQQTGKSVQQNRAVRRRAQKKQPS